MEGTPMKLEQQPGGGRVGIFQRTQLETLSSTTKTFQESNEEKRTHIYNRVEKITTQQYKRAASY